MRRELTDRQRDIYEFIAQTIRGKGYPPTIREVMEEFQIASTNGVRTTLAALEKKGYINRQPMLSRGIELTDASDRSVDRPDAPDVRQIPIIGRVAAGEPILATENVEGTLTVDRSFVPSAEIFALRVSGDSMKNIGILDGDYVMARQQDSADPGDIVVAIISEEATVKRLSFEGHMIRLLPENDAYDPIEVDPEFQDFRIAGKIVGLMRKL
jgi:repressor LexA